MEGDKKFLERPVAIVGLVGGLVGIVAAGVGIYSGLAAVAPQPTINTAQARIDECLATHGLSQASERREADGDRWYLRACSWPAPIGAGADGFSEITVRTQAGPGRSEADGMTVAHIFTSTCRDLEVTYLFDNQGSLVPEQPLRLTKGEVRRVEGGSVATGVEPGRDEFVALSSLRYTLEGARCV